MPLYKEIKLNQSTKLYLWKITEDFDDLFSQVKLNDSSISRLESMKSSSQKKGFLAVRMLLQHCGYSDFDMYYDDFGKPHLKLETIREKIQNTTNNHLHISISHSHTFSTIAISNQNIGIDIEILKHKIIKIAPRFMDITHLENLSNEDKIKKATLIWGIKESIFKVKNEVGISFTNHIFENKFSIEDKATWAFLKFNNEIEKYKIQFDIIEDYTFVCAIKENVVL